MRIATKDAYIVCVLILRCIDAAYTENLDGASCFYGLKWDRFQQQCTECDLGFYGIDCKKPCDYPLYGAKCLLTCNCSKKECHFIDGCRKSENNQNSSSKIDTNGKNVKNGNHYDTSAGQKRISPIMIGIIVLAAMALSILLYIIYTYIGEIDRRQGLGGDEVYQLNSII